MSERRRDPATGEWRIVAASSAEDGNDPCPLCSTGERAGAYEAAGYEAVVFDARFPALSADPPMPTVAPSRLYLTEPALGASEVVVYSDQHDGTLADLPVDRMENLVHVWADRYAELGRREEVAYVFIFENQGQAAGAPLHHPHGHVYAYPEIPPVPRRELEQASSHIDEYGTCVFCDVVARERADGVRLVGHNRSFLAFVPFAARFPYEVHIASRRHAASLLDLTDPERRTLAELLSTVVKGLHRLFGFSLPYAMSLHQAPTDDGQWQPVSHFHIELTPRHRTATEITHMAGLQLGAGEFVNDTLPERSAAELRAALERT